MSRKPKKPGAARPADLMATIENRIVNMLERLDQKDEAGNLLQPDPGEIRVVKLAMEFQALKTKGQPGFGSGFGEEEEDGADLDTALGPSPMRQPGDREAAALEEEP